jgi:hypothetical protein
MSPPAAAELTPEEIFEILSNKRRRMVLYYLRQRDETVAVKELARQIAALENDIPADELSSQQRKRVYVSLYQTHLPKMATTNIIAYDKDNGTVALTGESSKVEQYLSDGDGDTYSWRTHYIGLTIGSVSLVLLSLISTPVLAPISPTLAGSIAVGLYAISAAVQYWQQRRNDRIPVKLHHYE